MLYFKKIGDFLKLLTCFPKNSIIVKRYIYRVIYFGGDLVLETTAISVGGNNEDIPHIVNFENNETLKTHGVSFHWWNATATSLHSHNFCEFFIITTGEAVHKLNGESALLERGTMHFIRPEDEHIIKASNEKGCVHMNLCIRRERLEKIFDALGIDENVFWEGSPLKTVLSADELYFFTKKAEKINLMNFEGGQDSDFYITELIVQAVILLFSSRNKHSSDYPEWFSDILEKIHSPENIAVSVPEVYEMGDFSAPVMIKYFKKYTGKTVKAYLRDMKCDRACILLETTRLSTLKISTSLGYYSLSHFNRIFKEYTGMSPAAYRKKFLSKNTNRESI